MGIRLSPELILSQFPGKSLESWVESIQLSGILLESWANSNQLSGRHLSWKPKKGHTMWRHLGRKSKKCHSKWNPVRDTLLNQEYNWVMSWFESIFQKVFFWVMSRFESKTWKDFWVMSWFEIKFWIAVWVMSRFKSKLWKVIWVMSRYESNSRQPFRVVSWFESIIESHCESWVESESKFSETELNRIEKKLIVPMSDLKSPTLWLLEDSEKRRQAAPFFAWVLPVFFVVFYGLRPDQFVTFPLGLRQWKKQFSPTRIKFWPVTFVQVIWGHLKSAIVFYANSSLMMENR